MSSICPKCGTFMEGDICEKCQATEAVEKYQATQTKKKNKKTSKIIAIIALILIVLITTPIIFNLLIANKRAAQECYEEIYSSYNRELYGNALKKMFEKYNENHRGVDSEIDSKVDKLYNDIEKDLYEGIKSYDPSSQINKLALDACNDYIEYYPNGKHISEAKSIKDEIVNGPKYADCIVVEDGVAYYDMTLKTFISNYNKSIDNSDETDLVKAFMKLNTNPSRTTTSDGYYVYDVTNTAVSTNRAAVSMSITVGKNSKIVSVNFTIPSSAGVNTDISDSLMRSVATLTSPTSSLSSSEFDTMVSNLIDYGSAYHKGIFMGSYSSSGYRTYRLGALTEESYNEIK